MIKELAKEKTDKYDKILVKGIAKIKDGDLTKEEMKEIKSYSIKKALKLGKYVRN